MTTGIINVNRLENGECAVKVVYKSSGVWTNYDVEHDIEVVLSKYYNARRIKKYVKVVVNRKGYFNPYLGTTNIGPIKARPTNNGGRCTYFSRIVFA